MKPKETTIGQRAVGRIVLLLLSLLAVPLVAHPQTPRKVHRIGVLNMGPAPSAAEWQQSAFVQELRQLGYVEGHTIVIEQRYAAGKREQLSPLVDELIRLKLDLIVASGNAPAQALKAATSTIPLVAMGAGDLVGTGLVASLAHPGGTSRASPAWPSTSGGSGWSCSKRRFPPSRAWRSSGIRAMPP